MPNITRKELIAVAQALESLGERFVFLGGCVLPFLVDDFYSPSIRPTTDVDVAIQVASLIAYTDLEDRLSSVGFRHDMSRGAPKTRWTFQGTIVDVLPLGAPGIGWEDFWVEEALSQAIPCDIGAGTPIRIIAPPYFLAAKLQTFADRGNKDYFGSRDLEDIIALLDGCESLVDQLGAAPRPVVEFVAAELRGLRNNPDFLDALPGHLAQDSAAVDPAPEALETIDRIISLVS